MMVVAAIRPEWRVNAQAGSSTRLDRLIGRITHPTQRDERTIAQEIDEAAELACVDISASL